MFEFGFIFNQPQISFQNDCDNKLFHKTFNFNRETTIYIWSMLLA